MERQGSAKEDLLCFFGLGIDRSQCERSRVNAFVSVCRRPSLLVPSTLPPQWGPGTPLGCVPAPCCPPPACLRYLLRMCLPKCRGQVMWFGCWHRTKWGATCPTLTTAPTCYPLQSTPSTPFSGALVATSVLDLSCCCPSSSPLPSCRVSSSGLLASQAEAAPCRPPLLPEGARGVGQGGGPGGPGGWDGGRERRGRGGGGGAGRRQGRPRVSGADLRGPVQHGPAAVAHPEAGAGVWSGAGFFSVLCAVLFGGGGDDKYVVGW